MNPILIFPASLPDYRGLGLSELELPFLPQPTSAANAITPKKPETLVIIFIDCLDDNMAKHGDWSLVPREISKPTGGVIGIAPRPKTIRACNPGT